MTEGSQFALKSDGFSSDPFSSCGKDFCHSTKPLGEVYPTRVEDKPIYLYLRGAARTRETRDRSIGNDDSVSTSVYDENLF